MLGICQDFNFIKLKNEKNHVPNVSVLTPKRTGKKMENKAINATPVNINFSILPSK